MKILVVFLSLKDDFGKNVVILYDIIGKVIYSISPYVCLCVCVFIDDILVWNVLTLNDYIYIYKYLLTKIN